MSPDAPRLEDVQAPWPGVLIGSILLLPSLGLLWAFVDRLVDPGPRGDAVETAVLGVVSIGLFALCLALLTGRHRVAVDGAARRVRWTKSVCGFTWRSVSWQGDDLEAVAVEYGSTSRPFGRVTSTVWAVGPLGRREMSIGESRVNDKVDRWASELGLPRRDHRDDNSQEYRAHLGAAASAARTGHAPPRATSATSSTSSAPTAAAKRITPLSAIGGALAALVVFPALTWYRFGPTGIGYGLGFGGFLALLMLGVWFADRVDPGELEAPAFERSPFDWLGVAWLLSIPFGPLLGWLATEQITASNWRWMVGLRVFLSVVLPLLGALSLLRLVRGRHARMAGTVLVIGTAFPLLTGIDSTLDFVRGAVWRELVVTKVHGIAVAAGSRRTASSILVVDLAGGHSLRTVEGVEPTEGAARLLLLEGLGRILAAQSASKD